MSTQSQTERAERLPEKTVSAHPVKSPILIEITEEDRQNANEYYDNFGCLICTALKRMGYSNPYAGGTFIRTSDALDERYESDNIRPFKDLFCSLDQAKPPFYDSEVVGKQIILYPV